MSDAKDHVRGLLKDATDLAKSELKLTGMGTADAMVIVEVAKLLNDASKREGKKEKKVLPGTTLSPRPDPIQEARKKPRVPLMAPSKTTAAPAKAKAPAKKTARKR